MIESGRIKARREGGGSIGDVKVNQIQISGKQVVYGLMINSRVEGNEIEVSEKK